MVALADRRELHTPLRVLIAEDSEDDALLVRRELKRGGYEPEFERVETPEAMAKALVDSDWDVIISDYRMPRFTASEALTMSRESGLEAPFIVVSGKIGEDVAVEMMKAGAHDYVMKDNLARLSATVERGLEEVKERRERKRVERELSRRDAILEAVRFAAERLLGEAVGWEWEESVRAILRGLGEATEASRVYIFENFVGEDGEVWASMRHEWVARGVSAQMDNPLMEALPYRAAGYERWVEILGRGEPVYGHTRQLPESEQPELREQDILSIVVVPIFVEGRWWGFVGFDECVREREWSTAEVSALEAAASTLGSAIRRRRIEEELRQSEERFKALAEATFEGIAITLDGKIVETNTTFATMFGYEPSEVIGMSPSDFTAPESRETVRNARSSGLEEPYEVVSLMKNGTTFDTEIRGKMSSYKGHSVRVTVIRDITERKKNEEELRQSEELYRAVIEQATENIFLVDVETKSIVESNPAFRETLGYSEAELRSMRLYDVVAADQESIDANVRRILEHNNPFVGERKYRRKDGSLVDVEVSASTILLDGRETLCAVAHDVTERARAQRLLEERLATLSRIASSLTIDAPVERTLEALAESAVNASTATACSVMLAGEGTDTIRLVGSYGLPEGYTEGLQAAFRAGVPSPTLEVIRTRRPVLLREAREGILSEPLFAPIHRFADEVLEDTIYIVPLIFRGRVIGAINFGYLPDREPTDDERVFLAAVADQTAVAVENARLFAEARGKATLEERQRLARELHDSVSQALYGIALGAKTARTLLEHDPNRAADPLDYVLSLAEAGLTEMRALIFELRPESLEREGLVVALEKQAAALRARHEIEVESTLCEEPEASLSVKETVYRIVQEALHNTVKHARASNVRIKMQCNPEQIALEISDNGVGFDAQGDFPGHLGLRSMRERASRLGGSLEVESWLGRGTRIRAQIPV